MNWWNLTQPEIEPITRAEAKLHLRVDFTTDDALIDGLIQAAREHAEDILGRALIAREVRASFDGMPWREIVLPLSPVIDVRSILFYDTLNASTLVPTTDYIVDTDAWDGRIVLNDDSDWPDIDYREAKTVVIEYDAGYSSLAEEIPAKFRSAILLMVGHWYTHREESSQGQQVFVVPMAAQALLGMDRAVNL